MFDFQQLVLHTNGNLANGMGNLVQRTLRWIFLPAWVLFLLIIYDVLVCILYA